MRTSFHLIVYLISGNVFWFSVEGARGAANGKCHNTPMNRTAHLGGSVTLDCRYPGAEEIHIKHFYKEDKNHRSMKIEAESRNTQRDRFNLTIAEERGLYTVNIVALTGGDAGKYVCALKNDIETTCLTEIHLQILSWDDIKPLNLSYVTSKKAYINCSYTDKYKNNNKFLCKGENPTNCEKLISTNDIRDEAKSRFLIRDSPRHKYFYVYIENVRKSDSGTYWCRFGETLQHDSYTKLLLSVAEQKRSDSPGREEPGAETHEADSDDDDDDDDKKSPRRFILVLLFGILGCLLLTVAVVVLILCRQRLTCTREGNTRPGQNSQRENEDHNYEEIAFESQPVGSLPSVYATVNAPADQLHYSAVSFEEKDTNQADPGSPAPVSTIYSTVKNPEEQ